MPSGETVARRSVEFVEGLFDGLPGMEGFLDEKCNSCGLTRRQCFMNIVSEVDDADVPRAVGLDEKEQVAQVSAQILPFRSHDYSDNQTPAFDIPEPTTIQQRLIGIKAELNYALDQVEDLIDTIG